VLRLCVGTPGETNNAVAARPPSTPHVQKSVFWPRLIFHTSVLPLNGFFRTYHYASAMIMEIPGKPPTREPDYVVRNDCE
jgi:hypothetical protein